MACLMTSKTGSVRSRPGYHGQTLRDVCQCQWWGFIRCKRNIAGARVRAGAPGAGTVVLPLFWPDPHVVVLTPLCRLASPSYCIPLSLTGTFQFQFQLQLAVSCPIGTESLETFHSIPPPISRFGHLPLLLFLPAR